MNVIKVTGNNRKAVLDFLNEYMIGSHKPINNSHLLVCNENCYIELKNDYFTTHIKHNGPTITVKQARALYKPKETKAEKTQRSRAMMYKLKYEQLRDEIKMYSKNMSEKDGIISVSSKQCDYYRLELSSVNKLNESQSIQIETLSNSLVDIEGSNKHLQKQLDTSQDLYMKEREKTVRLTELWEENEKEVWHLKREKTSLNAKVIQSELEYEDLLHCYDTAKKDLKMYNTASIALALGVLALLFSIWIG